jgi:ATP-dependent Clp protease ATP-binding subunit ClpC
MCIISKGMIMNMAYKFTGRAEEAIKIANEMAIKLGHNYVGTEHILYGLTKEGKGVASKVLENQNIIPDMVLNKIEELIGHGEKQSKTSMGLTPRAKKVIENSFKEAKKLNSEYIGTEHLLVGIMREGDSIAVRIMIDLNMNSQKLYNELINAISENEVGSYDNVGQEKGHKSSYNSTPILNQFGNDLSRLAEEGKIDPVIGRKEEIERIIQILSRRTKNNPCLIGEPGVGKTAVVEGLAEKIVSGNIPENLRNKRVVTLDISGMVAGAKYRGDFEERVKKALKEVKKVGDVILFIDEIHTIVGAGAAEGAIDAANILKPLLARGEVQIIGATTLNEYRKYIEKDSALERRFQTIMVEEPSEEDTTQIIKGLRDKYEAHHNVEITDEAIITATKLASRYINDRFLPDKAIDVIDEAASKAKLKSYTAPIALKEKERAIQEIIREKEELVQMQEFERAAELRDKENKEKAKLEKEKQKWLDKNNKSVRQITEENIIEVISKWTGIPLNKITQDENEKLKNLEEKLHERVIGQNEAIVAISKAIRRSRVGLKDPKKPVGSFLFLGPTGVGKTELSKALAEILFGNENSIIRVDMSEYMEAHSTSKLIGSPPGYVGFDEAGGLTERVRRKPYSIILFDEIEKAHPDVLNILLQILDDGRLTDSHGRVVDFKNTVIIMTSNLGARQITEKKTLGFSSISEDEKVKEYENIKKEVMAEVKKEFKPEFINRIDEIIVFHKLTDEEIRKIAEIMLKQVQKRLEEKEIVVEIDEKAKDLIIKEGTDAKYGARPLKRAIQALLEDKIAEEIIEGKIINKAKITVEEGKIKLI